MHEVIARLSSFKVNKLVAGVIATGGVLALSLVNTAPAAACHCKALNETQIDRTTFSVSSEASLVNDVQVTKVVYEFGDGTTAEAATTDAAVTHTYAQSGEFEIKAHIFATIGGENRELDGARCVKRIEVKPEPPVFECSALAAAQIERAKYHLTATAATAHGAVFKNADFDFGDGQSANGIEAHGASVAIDHRYTNDGDYKITTTLHFTAGDAEESKTCAATIHVTPEACAFNPTLTKDSPDCKKPDQPQAPGQAQTPQSPPAAPQQPQAQLPQELPHTGPTEILGSTLGLGSLTAAGAHYIRSRRALRNIK